MSVNHRPIVMVVEDDVEMNELEREFMALYGLDAVAAYTGLEAIDLFQRRKADAVLLDVMLPEMDGFETCRRLRGMNNGHTPIVILTALDAEDCRNTGYKAGADAYFAKPFDPDEVVETLRDLIRRNYTPSTGEDRS
ncbi:MAG: response regulator transcription factor [Phycisphaerae bacterium]|jgi:DNA-binding response OmpR family regulator